MIRSHNGWTIRSSAYYPATQSTRKYEQHDYGKKFGGEIKIVAAIVTDVAKADEQIIESLDAFDAEQAAPDSAGFPHGPNENH